MLFRVMAKCYKCGAVWGVSCGVISYGREFIAKADGTKEIVGRTVCEKCPQERYQSPKCEFCKQDWAITVATKDAFRITYEKWVCYGCVMRPLSDISDFGIKAGVIYQVRH